MQPHDLSVIIKETAASLGFFDCGIARAEPLLQDAERLKQWLAGGFHAGMSYMERNRDKRTDPRLLVEGAKSVIVLLYNYFPGKTSVSGGLNISKYAYGADYHDVIRSKLNAFCDELRMLDDNVIARGFVDSAPVLERAWATRAGLGWIGKNSLLITRRQGSFFFLAEILTSLEPEYDEPFGGNYCGDCSRCIDACPAQAITAPGVIDSRNCISYLTIENKGDISGSFKGKFENWIFGCDICQDVCPWNRFSLIHSEPEFIPEEELVNMNIEDWQHLDELKFHRLFKHSAIKRTKFSGLKRNIDFVLNTDNK
jgi:epoxyqueuosine reductase